MLRNLLLPLTLLSLLFFVCADVHAQRGRGGDRGGRGGPSGGDRGGRSSFGGGPSAMLERMDRNGDGQLSPDEISERARGFLERIGNGKFDFSRPVSIKAMSSAVAERFGNRGGSERGSSDRGRSDRDRRGGDSRGRGGDDDRRRREEEERRRDRRERGDRDRGRGSSEEDLYPLVPRFGEETALYFGVSPDSLGNQTINLKQRYDRRVLEMVEGIMRRYDRDRNKILDVSEWRRMSRGGDPRKGDFNHDGRLTRAELAEAVSRRLKEEGGDRGDRGRGDRGSRARRGSDGKKEEEKPVTAAYRINGATRFGDRTSFRLLGRSDGKMDNLPSWFNDKNGDGQMTLDEMPGFSLREKLRDFDDRDFNRDGFITLSEATRDSDPEPEGSSTASK